MKKLPSKVLDYLSGQRVCSLTVLLANGSPHGAAMHFSHVNNPFETYIQTENTSKKCQALKKGGLVKASVVLGFSEDDFRTLQMDGGIKILPKSKLKEVHRIHYKKHPDAKQWKDDPATVFLAFRPTWWRYTEYKPKFFVLSSEKS